MRIRLQHLYVAAGCLGAVLTGTAIAQDVIKLGSVHPVTGPAANLGLAALRGTQVAVDEINAQGGIAVGGKRMEIRLAQYDDKCSAKDAVAVTERLINEDKVPLILGPICSHAALAAMELTEKSRIPMVNTVSASMQLTSQGYKYIFRTGIQTGMQSEAVSRFVHEDLGLKKAAFIGRNDAWCKSLSAQFRKRAEARGGAVLATEFFDLGATDFSPLLMKIKAANPDYLLICGVAEDAPLVVKQARELGIKATLFGSDDLLSEQSLRIAGPTLNGVYAFFGGGPTRPEALAYEQAFEKRFGQKSMYFDKAGYDGLMLVADAVKRAGSTEPERIAEALRSAKYQGIRGSYSFAPSGQAKGEVWMVKVENMKPRFLKEVSIYDNPPLPVDRE